MRRAKLAAFCFVLGLVVVYNPTQTPAQPGRKGGGGEFGKGGFGKGGGAEFGKSGFGGGQSPGGGGFGKGGLGQPQVNFAGQPQVNIGGQPMGDFGKGGVRVEFGKGGGGEFGKGGFGKGGGGDFGKGGGEFGKGGFGKGGGGGEFGKGGFGGGGGVDDPAASWDRIAQGRDSIDLNDPSARFARGALERRGIPPPPDGILTRQMFIEEATKRMAAGGGPGGPMGNNSGGGQPPGGPPGPNEGDRRLQQLDKDRDGRVSLDEADKGLRENFQKIDTNGDKFVDLEEYRAYYAAREAERQNRQQGGDDRKQGENGYGEYGRDRRDIEEPKPIALRYDHLPADFPKDFFTTYPWYKDDDGDKDGQVALHEWLRAGKSLTEFQDMDLNKDCLITADEILRFKRKVEDDAKIAALNDPDGTTPTRPGRFGLAGRNGNGGGNGGGFALPGSTPSASGYGDKGGSERSSTQPPRDGEKSNPFRPVGKGGDSEGKPQGKKGKN